jgi:hypothetical protein
MAESQLILTDEERDFLTSMLETALRDTFIEEHHTSSRAYRELVRRRLDTIEGLLGKLGRSLEAVPR